MKAKNLVTFIVCGVLLLSILGCFHTDADIVKKQTKAEIVPLDQNASTQIQDSNQITKTQVIILGTLHSFHYQCPDYSPEKLKEIIFSLQPDLILNELPLKKVESDGRPLKKFRRKNYPSGPESWAADTTAQKLGIKQIPFDREDRDDYYVKTNYFKRQEESNKALNEWFTALYLKDPNSLDSKVIEQLGTASHIQTISLNQRLLTAKLINSELFDSIIRAKNSSSDIIVELLKKYSAPGHMIDESIFLRTEWLERNKIMASKIVKASEENKGKRLVVITGSEHRYILIDLLKNNPNIELKEYWEIIGDGAKD